MYSYGPPHMAGQKQDDQLEHTYNSCVRRRDVALKTCQRRWTIGSSGERGSGISVLAARHDDDDEIVPVLLHISNYSIKRPSFVYTRVNGQRVLFLTIQFNESYLFARSLNAKEFYLNHRYDPIRCYHSGSGDMEEIVMKEDSTLTHPRHLVVSFQDLPHLYFLYPHPYASPPFLKILAPTLNNFLLPVLIAPDLAFFFCLIRLDPTPT